MEEVILKQDIENALSLLDVLPCSNDPEELINQFWGEIDARWEDFDEVMYPHRDELVDFDQWYTALVSLYIFITHLDGKIDDTDRGKWDQLKQVISIVKQHKEELNKKAHKNKMGNKKRGRRI